MAEPKKSLEELCEEWERHCCAEGRSDTNRFARWGDTSEGMLLHLEQCAGCRKGMQLAMEHLSAAFTQMSQAMKVALRLNLSTASLRALVKVIEDIGI